MQNFYRTDTLIITKTKHHHPCHPSNDTQSFYARKQLDFFSAS